MLLFVCYAAREFALRCWLGFGCYVLLGCCLLVAVGCRCFAGLLGWLALVREFRVVVRVLCLVCLLGC